MAPESYKEGMQDEQLHSWREWYSFACKTLGYKAQEATEYANLRYAEELNRRPTSKRAQNNSC